MEGVREYLLSVTAAALLCGITRTLCPADAGPTAILKLVCGLFLCFTVIRPIARIQLADFPPLLEDVNRQAQTAAAAGQISADSALRESIIARSEAYILDKAAAWDAEVQLEFTLSNDSIPIPEQVTVRGDVSPYVKRKLQDLIETGLGIPKEDQLWLP